MNDPQGFWQVIGALGLSMFAATIGRLTWHVSQVQSGNRAFFSWHLVWELMLAVGMGLLGRGVADYAGLAPDGYQALALISALAYLGPRGTEAVLCTYFAKSGKGKKP
jgi:hypothetical protein